MGNRAIKIRGKIKSSVLDVVFDICETSYVSNRSLFLYLLILVTVIAYLFF